MNVVDSCGWLEFIANGDNAGFFAPILENESQLLVPPLVIFEVTKRMLILGQHKALEFVLAVMQRCKCAELDSMNLIKAAQCSIQYKLAMADAIIWQTAVCNHAKLYTQDAAFIGLAQVEYVKK